MEKLFELSERKIRRTRLDFKRYLFDEIRHENRLICIKGARGVGKTTLLLQYMKEYFPEPGKALYVSLDQLYFTNNTLSDLADQFIKNGGEALFIDEVHKYPEWSREIKNIYDFYDDIKIVFTGSSLLKLHTGEGDLSRRAVNYYLPELSFREFIHLNHKIVLPAFSMEEILKNHETVAAKILGKIKPIPLFNEYLKFGNYPYSLGNRENYLQQLSATIIFILENDLPSIHHIDFFSIQKIKKLLYIISEIVPFKPNISELAVKTGATRTTILQYLDFLEKASVINLLKSGKKGMTHLSKPEKIYLRNPNLLYALAPDIPDKGTLRETFFFNQLSVKSNVNYTEKGDFIVDSKYTIEVGGKTKNTNQIKDIKNSFVVADDIETGYKNKIPLWLFGFLY